VRPHLAHLDNRSRYTNATPRRCAAEAIDLRSEVPQIGKSFRFARERTGSDNDH
jgi:hypothetical protein